MTMLQNRSTHREYMDEAGFTDTDILDAFRFIRKVNSLLGGISSTLYPLKKFSKRWHSKEIITILDIGTGCADIPIGIVRWARTKGFRVKILALDVNFKTLQLSQETLQKYPEIQLVCGDALQLPVKHGKIDYVLSAMFFHHLNDERIIQLLQNANLVAKRGIIINDLSRDYRAYAWIVVFTSFLRNSHIANDARISVKKGFTHKELSDYINKSGVSYLKIVRHFAHRCVLYGEKHRK